MRRAPIRLILAAVLAFVGVTAPRSAKLAVFHNGRMLQVQEVREDAGWYYLTLGKSARIGVPMRLIAEIRDMDGDLGPSLPNVQASAGGGGGSARQVTRAPVARPVSPALDPQQAQEMARSRAEELAQRGRTLGGDLQNLRQGALESNRGERPGNAAQGGIDLTGNQDAWPSPFRNDRSARGGRRDTPPAPDEQDAAEEEDN